MSGLNSQYRVPSTEYRELREEPVAGAIPRFAIPGWRERFGVVAGITGRGSEEGRGFDLGLWTDSPVNDVMTRWRAFRGAEPGFEATVLGNQVHQTAVQFHGSAKGWVQLEGLDGHATATKGILLSVTVADCVPVYLLDPVKKAVALLHAGWRGTAGRILAQGVETLREAVGSVPADLIMHCGVSICGNCYEVGSEVMLGCGKPADGAGPWHLDLRSVLADQAALLGIRSVSVSEWCSAHDARFFYSHRRSRGSDGRMVAYLGMPKNV
ncbi:MAG TPA: polyphenol oxidase family protein [Gemmatimonadales bacterium]|nr:polyphenol oxidase family protein [Gemmatimonadales bacterium]